MLFIYHSDHDQHHSKHDHDLLQATTSKGAQPLAPADFQPVVKKSVCYIVAAVLFNEKNEVTIFMETSVFVCVCRIRTTKICAQGLIGVGLVGSTNVETKE